MEFLRIEYLKQLFQIAGDSLLETIDFSQLKFSDFDTINTYLINEIYTKAKANLLISLPQKDQIGKVCLTGFLLPVLKCILYNSSCNKCADVGDMIVELDCGTISYIKEIKNNKIQTLPILTTKRIDINIETPFLILNQKVKSKVAEIQNRITLEQKRKGLENLKLKLLEEIGQLQSINKYYNKNVPLEAPNEKSSKMRVAHLHH